MLQLYFEIKSSIKLNMVNFKWIGGMIHSSDLSNFSVKIHVLFIFVQVTGLSNLNQKNLFFVLLNCT